MSSGALEPERLVCVLANDVAGLEETSGRAHAWLAQRGFGPRVLQALDLVIDELVGNSIRYGYASADGTREGRIRLEIEVRSGAVHVLIEDDGCAFDPTAHPEPPPPTSIEEAPIGGRGLPMVRRVIEGWSYCRQGGKNRLELSLRSA